MSAQLAQRHGAELKALGSAVLVQLDEAPKRWKGNTSEALPRYSRVGHSGPLALQA